MRDGWCACYTRNMVSSSDTRSLRRAALSAFSLRIASPRARIWLLTDTAVSSVGGAALVTPRMAIELAGRPVFDHVWSRPENSFEDAASELVAALAKFPDSRAARIARSRIGRLRYLAAPPCAKSFFVDDDTYFCPSPLDLDDLWNSKADARMFLFYKTPGEHAIDARARSCERGADASLASAVRCYDEAGAFVPEGSCGGGQGGALAVRRSERATAFARDWLSAYVADRDARTSATVEAENWLDQSALRRLSLEVCDNPKNWTLGHLPYVLNYRAVKNYAFVGRVRIVHQKVLFPPTNASIDDHRSHLDAVCDRLNARLGDRSPTIYSELEDLSFDATIARTSRKSTTTSRGKKSRRRRRDGGR